MAYQAPVGTRDLLPLEVAQKRWIEERLQQVFQRWSYHCIITSTLERIDTLMAGGAIQPSTVIQLQNMEDEALGLRPELTASVARAVLTRTGEITQPHRLYYAANVFRRASQNHYNRQLELYQAGVELLGVGGIAADAEILLLLSDCISQLNLGQWSLILGEAGLTQSLLSVFPDGVRETVRRSLAHLDRIALEQLSLSSHLLERALLLLDLRGQPEEVFTRLARLDLTEEQIQTVNQLKSLVELLRTIQTQPGAGSTTAHIILDLSLIRTFDYYTGVVFEVVSNHQGNQRVLGQGGRYDYLLGLYHPCRISSPGIGFSLNVEEIHQALLPTGQLPSQMPSSNWLVVPTTPAAYAAAFIYAQKIRESTNLVRVELNLSEQTQPETIHAYAQQRSINQIAWVNEAGMPRIETISDRNTY
jgi:ATP phosphoribosyltransferase regulatory subunit